MHRVHRRAPTVHRQCTEMHRLAGALRKHVVHHLPIRGVVHGARVMPLRFGSFPLGSGRSNQGAQSRNRLAKTAETRLSAIAAQLEVKARVDALPGLGMQLARGALIVAGIAANLYVLVEMVRWSAFS